jgi:hypothetical protein
VRLGNANPIRSFATHSIGGVGVSERSLREAAEIEATQAALRDSIEATKQLAKKAETLLQQHKATLEEEAAKSAH